MFFLVLYLFIYSYKAFVVHNNAKEEDHDDKDKDNEEDEIIFRLSKYPYTQNITIHSINPWTDEVVGTNLKIPNQIYLP